jgi:hypothetical protein
VRVGGGVLASRGRMISDADEPDAEVVEEEEEEEM